MHPASHPRRTTSPSPTQTRLAAPSHAQRTDPALSQSSTAPPNHRPRATATAPTLSPALFGFSASPPSRIAAMHTFVVSIQSFDIEQRRRPSRVMPEEVRSTPLASTSDRSQPQSTPVQTDHHGPIGRRRTTDKARTTMQTKTRTHRAIRVVQKVFHRVARSRERLLEDLRQRRHRRVVVLPMTIQLPQRALERVRQGRVCLRRVESVCGYKYDKSGTIRQPNPGPERNRTRRRLIIISSNRRRKKSQTGSRQIEGRCERMQVPGYAPHSAPVTSSARWIIAIRAGCRRSML